MRCAQTNLGKDGSTIIGNSNVTVWGDQDLIETTGTLDALLEIAPTRVQLVTIRTREVFTMLATVFAATM